MARPHHVVLAALVLLVAAACSDETGPAASTSSSSEATTSAAPASTVAPTTAAGSTSTGPPPSAVAACTSDAVMPVVQAALDRPPDIQVVSVQILACVNGYAQVVAVPTGPTQQNEQVFLLDDGGTWIVIASGTGIDCADVTNLSPVEQQACTALGSTP